GPSSGRMSGFAPNRKLNYTLRFDGPDDAAYTATASTMLIDKNTRIPSSYVLPALSIPGSGYTLAVKPSPAPNSIVAETSVFTENYYPTTPGKYRIAITVTPSFEAAALTPSKEITVTADRFMSELLSSPTWKKTAPGKRLSVALHVPYYQAGASVTAKYKAAGSSKWKTVARGTVKNWNPILATASLKVPGKYTKKAGAFKFTVGSVSYSAGYTTESVKYKPKKAQRF
ncbi:MAG: hypothetical protein J0H64_04635, partial [Actinobacteria bacterium]|nr:hypothetical protein [Actinomycetota bacterium]